MSIFRKPKKIQRRVFSTLDEEDEGGSRSLDRMDVDDIVAPPPPVISERKADKDRKMEKSKESKKSGKIADLVDATKSTTTAKSLLSFADDEDDAEVFQVRKSSHSKKVMRMMDKERRKKMKEERDDRSSNSASGGSVHGRAENGSSSRNGASAAGNGSLASGGGSKYKRSSSSSSAASATASSASKSAMGGTASASAEQCKSKKTDSIQTEIRTDDFVLVVKQSEPPAPVILNGRAAYCAGRNDMSSDEEEASARSEDERGTGHRFSKPEQLKQMLEAGSIPDAAMIHAARKRRQKAREQGEFVAVEEPKEVPKRGSRLAREDVEGDNSDDEERVDMNGITGVKEREERREQFYSVQNDYSEEDSDREMHEWENQQIRKGVTGAQLVNAQQESVLSRFMIRTPSTTLSSGATATTPRSLPNALVYGAGQQPLSTSTLLEQAYAKSSLEKPRQQHKALHHPHQLLAGAAKTAASSMPIKRKEKPKTSSLRTPKEIRDAIASRLDKLKETNAKHTSEIERIVSELKLLRLEEMDCKERAPTAAAKYRFYQEVKCYVTDLVDCLNEKAPLIADLEKRVLQLFAKHHNFLIERRRQDVRDQAKEMAEASKPATMVAAVMPRRIAEQEEQVRRAAEREGRRTRRRCEREKNELLVSHLDGMSSDEETSDRYQEQLQNSLEQIEQEAALVFADVNDEFCKAEFILMKFYAWRTTDMESYKDAFVNLCLPKILGLLVRLEMLTWSPLLEENKDIEKMNWYQASMLHAWSEQETEVQLQLDPDVNLVPTIIERIVLPKVTEIVNQCWDPLSTTKTLRLIGFINRLGRDYPLKESSKSLRQLFGVILDKMKLALENDVFIPIFPKQVQEAKTSFFQRQFCSGLKLFRNFLSWQGIVADKPLRDLAISALLNRYLLLAMRVCSANDAIAKAYIVVNTLPTVWLQIDAADTLDCLEQFVAYIRQTLEGCDAKNPVFMQTCEKAKQVLQRLHSFK